MFLTRGFVSIQKKLVGMTTLLAVFTCVSLAGVIGWRASSILSQESNRQVDQALKGGQRNATEFLKNNRSTLELWATNPVLTSIIENPSMKAVFENSLKDFFEKAKMDAPWIVTAVIHSSDEVLFDNADFLTTKSINDGDFGKLLQSNSAGSTPTLIVKEGSEDKSMLLQSVKIPGKDASDSVVWNLTLILDPSLMNQQLFKDIRIGKKGFVTLNLQNSSTEVLKHSSAVMETSEWQSLKEISVSNNDKSGTPKNGLLLSRKSLEAYPIDVVAVAVEKDIREPIVTLMVSVVVVSLITCLVGIFFARRSAVKFSAPIKELSQDVAKLGLGELASRSKVKTNDEIGKLADQFNSMATTLQYNTQSMQSLIHHGQIISSQSTFKSVFDTLSAACTELAGENFKFDLYFHSNCFVGEVLTGGYYEFLPSGDIADNPTDLSKDSNSTSKMLLVTSPDGNSPLAQLKVPSLGKKGDLLLPSLQVLLNNVASAITTIQFNKTFQALSKKTKEIFTIFENIGQGIALIDGQGKFGSEYSAHLEHILDCSDMGGKDALELIFRDSDVSADQVSQAETVLACIGEDTFSWEMNSSLLPREFCRIAGQNKKYIEVDWIPVTDHRGEIVERVMVTIRDVTLLYLLRETSEKNKKEMETIHQIVSLPPERFSKFLDGSFQYVADCREMISRQSKIEENSLALIKRNLHTIKGNSRALNLTQIAEQMHNTETQLAEILSANKHAISPDIISNRIEEVNSLLISYDELNRKRLNRSPEKVHEQKRFLLDTGRAISGVLSSLDSKLPGDLKLDLARIKETIVTQNTVTLKHVCHESIDSLKNLLKVDLKDLPKIRFNINLDGAVTSSFEKLMSLTFVHLFNNSIVHGFGGEIKGQEIVVDFHSDDGFLTLIYQDSGKGLNIDMLFQKGNDLNVLSASPSDEEVGDLIFLNGLSTASQVTMSAGRGAGMDAVRSECQALGGNIKVVFSTPKNEQGFRKFFFECVFPKSSVFESSLEWTTVLAKNPDLRIAV
jgi:HAMP domain-containing protein